MLSNSRTESAAAGASTKENPRRKFATGSAGLASVVRGSSRRIMIMRFRPANISLINRRLYLPRLLLSLSSKKQIQKLPNDSQMLTGSHHIDFWVDGYTGVMSREAHGSSFLWGVRWRRDLTIFDPVRGHRGPTQNRAFVKSR